MRGIQYFNSILSTDCLDPVNIGIGEARLLEQEVALYGLPIPILSNHHHRAFRIRHLQFCHCGSSNRDEAQVLLRRIQIPASDSEDAIGAKLRKVIFECFHGIEIIFSEGEGPRGRGCPSVHQSSLDDVILPILSSYEASTFIDHAMHLRQIIKTSCEGSECASHDVVDGDG